MDAKEICISLLVMSFTMLLTALLRRASRKSGSVSLGFLMEMTGTFQICACTHELILLAQVPPKPHVALTLTYIFTALHGWSLPGSFNNPASNFHHFFRNRFRLKDLCLQVSGQFLGAILANLYMKLIWQLGMSASHSGAVGQGCNNPMQVAIEQAFILELVFSFLFHLILLHFESSSPDSRVHLAALVITTLVFAGSFPFSSSIMIFKATSQYR